MTLLVTSVISNTCILTATIIISGSQTGILDYKSLTGFLTVEDDNVSNLQKEIAPTGASTFNKEFASTEACTFDKDIGLKRSIHLKQGTLLREEVGFTGGISPQ